MRLFWLASATTWPGDIGTTSSWPSLTKSNDVRRSKGMIRDEQDGMRSLLLCSSLTPFVSDKRAERRPKALPYSSFAIAIFASRTECAPELDGS